MDVKPGAAVVARSVATKQPRGLATPAAGLLRFARNDGAHPSPARIILAFVAICAIEKAVAMLATGFNDDEAYTLVISRTLALSYFDHPPLHQWILHGFVALFGESRWARAPFWLMIVTINWPLFGLTRRLFGVEAALWALFAFNATPYFLVLPDGFIMPDTPLLLFLAVAGWAIAEILFAPPGGRRSAAALWSIAGLALGCAGLAKYSAIFAPVGLLGFFLGSPRHRHWLWDFRPWLGAGLALLVFAPALVWNMQNHWVSFAFQSNRAVRRPRLRRQGMDRGRGGPRRPGRADLALGRRAARCWRWRGGCARDADGGERFLLWLTTPPVVLVRADAAARAARDPALVQFRLAVRISAGGILAEREKRRLAANMVARQRGAIGGDGPRLPRRRHRRALSVSSFRAERRARSLAIQL